jgi:hypothetical protein
VQVKLSNTCTLAKMSNEMYWHFSKCTSVCKFNLHKSGQVQVVEAASRV